MLWGVEAQVLERFMEAGVAPSAVACTRETFTFEHDGPPASFLDLFRQYCGPTMNAYDAAEKSGRAADLQRELLALFEAQNTSGRPDRTVISPTLMRVSVALPWGSRPRAGRKSRRRSPCMIDASVRAAAP